MDCRSEATVRKLYESTGRAAISKTAHLVGRIDVAEEIVQEVFLKLWKAKLTFPNEKAAYVWIYRACHNAAIDHLRSATRKRESGVSEEEAERLGGVTASDAVADRQTLLFHLRGLKETEARVLAYRVIDGMSQEEIAEIEGCSRKTIVRLCRKIDDKLRNLKGA